MKDCELSVQLTYGGKVLSMAPIFAIALHSGRDLCTMRQRCDGQTLSVAWSE